MSLWADSKRVDQPLTIGYTVAETQRFPPDGVVVNEHEALAPPDNSADEVADATPVMTDEDVLVEQAKTDKEAFGQLYIRYVDKIFSYIYYRTNNWADAEDLTSRVFHRALDHIKDYEHRGVPFSAWLYRIAHNLVANWHRDESRRKVLPLDDMIEVVQRRPSPDRQVEADEELVLLRQAIQELPPDRQELLVLKFEAQLPNAQIGHIMGRSEGAIKSLYHRTLIALREELKKRGL